MTFDAQQFINDLDSNPTPEQLAILDEVETSDGDTDTPSESNETPAVTESEETETTTTDNVDSESTEVDANTNDDADAGEPEKVILAKDGKHTIPYDVLEREREKASQALNELEQLKQQMQQQPASAEKTQQEKQIDFAQEAIEQGVDAGIFGDFTEEDLAKGIKQIVQDQVSLQVKEALAPVAEKQIQEAQAQHFQAINEKHPDATSIVESQEFDKWMKSQPTFVQESIGSVLQKGTAEQVIELFDNYKSATQAPSTTQTTEQLKQKAKEVVSTAKAPVPTSLTDLGGHAAPTSIGEQIPKMNPVDMIDEMATWSPEKINNYLNGI